MILEIQLAYLSQRPQTKKRPRSNWFPSLDDHCPWLMVSTLHLLLPWTKLDFVNWTMMSAFLLFFFIKIFPINYLVQTLLWFNFKNLRNCLGFGNDSILLWKTMPCQLKYKLFWNTIYIVWQNMTQKERKIV